MTVEKSDENFDAFFYFGAFDQSHISKTNTIQEFNFTLAYLLNDLLPDGEKHLKIRECL